MKKIPFTVSARTARLIGRENVSHAEGAVIELVKNCYDADADFAIVAVNPAKQSILIIDNGSGMSLLDLEHKWMHIGTDNKEKSYTSDKGRIKAGAKGIGRFALDRLGEHCVLYTKAKGEKSAYKWSANWADFEESGAKIGNVFATIHDVREFNFKEILLQCGASKELLSLVPKKQLATGTIIEIKLLRDEWTEELSDKIFRSLEVLTPPEGQHKFDIFFVNEDYDKYGKIENSQFTDYDYKIKASYEKNQKRELTLEFHRNEFDYNLIDKVFFDREEMKSFPYDRRTFKKERFVLDTNFFELIPGLSESERKNITSTIGDFDFTLYFFKLGTNSGHTDTFKYKEFNTTARRNWVGKFGGIKMFRDNFRVRPYGEVGTASYDWLRLGERQGKNPAGVSRVNDFNIKPNQVAGTVTFSRTSKLFLNDKSGREGLIENETFELFKNILIGIIEQLESDRSTIASNLGEYFKEVNSEEQAEAEAVEIAENEDGVKSAEETAEENKKLKSGIRAQRKKIQQKDEELVMSRAMASAGILIASFSHEFNYLKNRLNNRSSNLKIALSKLLPESKTANLKKSDNPYYLIQQQKELDEKIKQWIEFSLALTKKDRRKAKIINLVTYLDEFKQGWRKKLTDRGIALQIKVVESCDPKDFKVKMIELDIDTIFDNLIANSIEAFQRDGFKGDRIITITLNRKQENIEMEYRDSGPGLSKDIKKPAEIFKPFVTTKRDKTGTEIGTGLGMWLLKLAVDSNNGSTKLSDSASGFAIKIFLKPV